MASLNLRAGTIHIVICLSIGALVAAFTEVRWVAASLWTSAGLFINGSIAIWEDAMPGGFDNPDGTETPDFVEGRGAVVFWLHSIGITAGLVILGLCFQFW